MNERVLGGQFLELGIVTGVADETLAGRLTEGKPETQVRARADKNLVEVLDGLDEMRLAQDDV